MGTEIERKFLINEIPSDLERYSVHIIEQAYLNTSPAIRVRREDKSFYMTYKADREGGGIGKTEYNMELDEKSYTHLLSKADGRVIRKKRYIIPLNDGAFDEDFLRENPQIKEAVKNGDIKIELDVFADSAPAPFADLIMAEVEFPTEEAAAAYRMASWFKRDVTGEKEYSNSYMAVM